MQLKKWKIKIISEKFGEKFLEIDVQIPNFAKYKWLGLDEKQILNKKFELFDLNLELHQFVFEIEIPKYLVRICELYLKPVVRNYVLQTYFDNEEKNIRKILFLNLGKNFSKSLKRFQNQIKNLKTEIHPLLKGFQLDENVFEFLRFSFYHLTKDFLEHKTATALETMKNLLLKYFSEWRRQEHFYKVKIESKLIMTDFLESCCLLVIDNLMSEEFASILVREAKEEKRSDAKIMINLGLKIINWLNSQINILMLENKGVLKNEN